jgi:hypothetical protein
MNNIYKTSNLSASEEILNKIKKLKVDKLYSYSSLGKPDDKKRVYLSRLADKGTIVKAGRGKFYKPTNKTLFKQSDKIIPLNKSLFVNDLFWSVSDGFKINADELIKAYLVDYSEEDLMGLYSLFGYKRLLNESLKLYKKRTDKKYQKIREILMRFEKWRLND